MLGKGGVTYILSNFNRTSLYVGVTSALKWRIIQHKEKKYPRSFSARYNTDQLVSYEIYDSFTEAIAREKYLKGKFSYN